MAYEDYSHLRDCSIANRISLAKDSTLHLLQNQKLTVVEAELIKQDYQEAEQYEMCEGIERALKLYKDNPQYALQF